jgi:hypothetical protein
MPERPALLCVVRHEIEAGALIEREIVLDQEF